MDDEKLIILVQANECLYNKNCIGYKLPQKKSSAWREISAEMQVPEEMVVKRWACIRNRYAREKRQENLPSGSGSKMKSQWPLMKAMDFIDPFIVPRSMRCSFNCVESFLPSHPSSSSHLSQSPVLTESPLPSPVLLSPLSESQILFEPIEAPPTTPVMQKRKRHDTNEDDHFAEALGAFKNLCESRIKNQNEEEKNPLHGFKEMIAAIIGNMSKAKQIKAMQKVTMLVMEMMAEPE